ncbi:MAG: tRNA (adenosine(37)-N6)-threonylcarbamoyltransferase complex dimerization subunit type 1 TsaB [Chitinophagaceae bacterium]|nr:tRNA (adenosine(37)-N6)-threonylcarbamoyltransferase complex dimerization subunit type 1 TsaB [Chitinophagaceae bacterium]MBP9102505.1 tRNA (adenosine(37)-N6)-threonylcarbamoyltransferase complex dimerization subunit type 1 TsaB [Chitinophagaceae bacterium]
MSLLLHIDTALSVASVCLSNDKDSIALSVNENQQGHAAWLHQAIDEIMKSLGHSMKELDAVSVSIGPGSYTGLRVGLSSAKGLCYSLNIPLITIATTELIASAITQEAQDLICSVIDARRMEIYSAIYDKNLKEIKAPHSLIIDETSFVEFLNTHKILFCGDGCKKLQTILRHENVTYSSTAANATHLAQLAFNRFKGNDFADLAYAEPLYVKEFYSSPRKN